MRNELLLAVWISIAAVWPSYAATLKETKNKSDSQKPSQAKQNVENDSLAQEKSDAYEAAKPEVKSRRKSHAKSGSHSKTAAHPKHAYPLKFSGNASWYGVPFHGRRTASGVIFNMNKLTCAHKTLPFYTKVLVEDPRTGKTVIVSVLDRGPFVSNRVMDLSRQAARDLGTLLGGVRWVDCVVIDDSPVKADSPRKTGKTDDIPAKSGKTLPTIKPDDMAVPPQDKDHGNETQR